MSYCQQTIDDRVTELSQPNAFEYGVLFLVSISSNEYYIGVSHVNTAADDTNNCLDMYKNNFAVFMRAKLVYDPMYKFERLYKTFCDNINDKSHNAMCIQTDAREDIYKLFNELSFIPGHELSIDTIYEPMVEIPDFWFRHDPVYEAMYHSYNRENDDDCSDGDESD